MKFNYMGYEFDVKARRTGILGRNYNKEDTYAILNYLSTFAYDSYQYWANLGIEDETIKKLADEIHYVLDNLGYYDNVKDKE